MRHVLQIHVFYWGVQAIFFSLLYRFTVVLDGCSLRMGEKQKRVHQNRTKIDRMAPIYVLDL